MQKITTFLTYENRAEEAAKFYVSIFKNSKVGRITHYGDAMPELKGRVMTVEFQLDGQDFVALNGGSHFKFTDGVSLSVACKDQQEVDTYSARFAEGGEQLPCGWIKDKFGMFWQITPTILTEMIHDRDSEKANRAMQAMLGMHKIDIETLKRAYAGEEVSTTRRGHNGD